MQNTTHELGEQWDAVRTIRELEALNQNIMTVVDATVHRLGKHVGTGPDGETMVEHPLGQARYAVEEALRACYAKYGRDLYMDGMSLNAQAAYIEES